MIPLPAGRSGGSRASAGDGGLQGDVRQAAGDRLVGAQLLLQASSARRHHRCGFAEPVSVLLPSRQRSSDAVICPTLSAHLGENSRSVGSRPSSLRSKSAVTTRFITSWRSRRVRSAGRCGNVAAILELDEHLEKNFKVRRDPAMLAQGSGEEHGVLCGLRKTDRHHTSCTGLGCGTSSARSRFRMLAAELRPLEAVLVPYRCSRQRRRTRGVFQRRRLPRTISCDHQPEPIGTDNQSV